MDRCQEINIEDRAKLSRPFCEEEMKAVIDGIKKNKANGVIGSLLNSTRLVRIL